jgi:hypothetical protein
MTLTYDAFKGLFYDALDAAGVEAAEVFGGGFDRPYTAKLYGAGYSGADMDADACCEALFVDDQRVWLYIDIAAMERGPHGTRFFVRASGHEPGLDIAHGPLSPFKIAVSGRIVDAG